MTATRAAAATATLLALALTLGACGDDDGDAGSEPTSGVSTTSESAEASETTTQEPEPLPSNYPEVGLKYKGLPDLAGDHRGALETFIAFDRARLRVLREVRLNPQLRRTASPALVATFTNTVDYMTQHHAYYRGVTMTSFEDVEAKGKQLTLDLCLDATKLRWVENGQAGPVGGDEREMYQVVVTKPGGTWRVTEFGSIGLC